MSTFLRNHFTLLLLGISQWVFTVAAKLTILAIGEQKANEIVSADVVMLDDSQIWGVMAIQSGSLKLRGFVGSPEALQIFKYKKVPGQIVWCRNLHELRTDLVQSFDAGK